MDRGCLRMWHDSFSELTAVTGRKVVCSDVGCAVVISCGCSGSCNEVITVGFQLR